MMEESDDDGSGSESEWSNVVSTEVCPAIDVGHLFGEETNIVDELLEQGLYYKLVLARPAKSRFATLQNLILNEYSIV